MITARLHQNSNWPTRWVLVVREPNQPEKWANMWSTHIFADSEQDAMIWTANVLAARYPDKHDDLELVIA